jgi:hypothetical protein
MLRRQDSLDRQPGPAPDIRTGARGLIFEMHPAGIRNSERLVIRCDGMGEVWISIQTDAERDA